MKKTLNIFICVIILILAGCTSHTTKEKSAEVARKSIDAIPAAASKTGKTFRDSFIEVQKFKVNGAADTLLTGKQGTKVKIPAQTFVNQKGEVITDEIDIELSEFSSVPDMLLADLHTSRGKEKRRKAERAIFVAAYYKGELLSVHKEKYLYYEVPLKSTPSKLEVLHSSVSEEEVNWELHSSQTSGLVSIPLNSVSLYLYTTEKKWHPRELKRLRSRKYENTFIATPEFEQRANTILNDGDATSNLDPNTTVYPDPRLLDIYLNNIDKNLWEADSMAYFYLKNKFTKEFVEKFHKFTKRSISKEVNKLLSDFKQYYEQRHTKVKNISAYQSVLKREDAFERLVAKGMKKEEALEVINLYNRQQAVIRARNKEKNKQNMVNALADYAFISSEAGWWMLARPYDSYKKYVNVKLEVQAEAGLDYYSLKFVSESHKHEFFHIDSRDKYLLNEFASEKGLERTWPFYSGTEGTFVAIGYKGDRMYFAMLKVEEIGSKNKKIPIRLEPSTIEEIKNTLSKTRFEPWK